MRSTKKAGTDGLMRRGKQGGNKGNREKERERNVRK